MEMTRWAFGLFVAGAAGGLSLALLNLLRRPRPRWFGRAHGLLGLLALTLLFAANLLGEQRTPGLAWWTLGLLAAALAGGLLLLRVLFPGRKPPLLIALHGGLALAGLYLLYQVAFG